MSSMTIPASDYTTTATYGLKDYSEYSERTTDINVHDDGPDQTAGEWYYVDEEPLKVEGDNGTMTFRVIYHGSWGNDNSPGASHFTDADLYDVSDADETAEFEREKARLESLSEYLPSEEDTTVLPTAFLDGYLDGLLFAELNDDGGEPLSPPYTRDDISDETRDIAREHCKDFLFYVEESIGEEALNELLEDAGQAGIDFALSRNGHGAGFFDGDYGTFCDRLQDAAKTFGGYSLYIGDDGMVYGQ